MQLTFTALAYLDYVTGSETNLFFPDFIIASPKSEIQPVIGIDEVGYSPLLLGNAEGSFYNVVILRACNLNSNYRLGYPQGLIYRVWTSG